MKQETSLYLTKILLTAAAGIGGAGELLGQWDQILGIILKGISIISFAIVIIINWPNLIITVKSWFK